MNTINFKLQAVVIALLAGLNTAAVAESQEGEATATVITPLVITVTDIMNFTTIASGSTGGDLTMDDAGNIAPSGPGDANVVGGSTGTPLGFTVDGEANTLYTLTVSNGVLALPGGGSPMTLNMDAPVYDNQLAGGSESITVGGTLTLGASQPAGNYSTANDTPITITANYD